MQYLMNCSTSGGSGSLAPYVGLKHFPWVTAGHFTAHCISLSFLLLGFFLVIVLLYLVFPVALETTKQFLIADLSYLLKLEKV